MTTLTVFTPTYNRGTTMPRVFESLQRQTSRDFQWLVVDDGSTDDTQSLVKQWQAEADFAIDYVFQSNSGKHSAHNAAVTRTVSELFLILDSDDELLPHAVGLITATWNGMNPAERKSIAGIWTLCVDPEGNIVDGPFPWPKFDATLQELVYKHRFNKEMLPTFVTDVLRRHPFPTTPPGLCPYIPESYVWLQITKSLPIRFLNVACRIYHPSEGLSVLSRKEYPLSRCIVFGYLAPLRSDISWFSHWPGYFVLNAVQAGRYAIFSGEFWKLAGHLPLPAQLLLVCTAPVAIALLLKDRVSGRIAREIGSPRVG